MSLVGSFSEIEWIHGLHPPSAAMVFLQCSDPIGLAEASD